MRKRDLVASVPQHSPSSVMWLFLEWTLETHQHSPLRTPCFGWNFIDDFEPSPFIEAACAEIVCIDSAYHHLWPAQLFRPLNKPFKYYPTNAPRSVSSVSDYDRSASFSA